MYLLCPLQVPVAQNKNGIGYSPDPSSPTPMTSVCKNGGEEAVWLARLGLHCYGALLRQWPFDGAPTSVLSQQNLASTIMVLAGC